MKSIAKANGRNTALTSASHINEAHRIAIETASKAMFAGIERAIEVGRLLAEEKAKHQHGEWIPWIENNLEFNRKQAAGYLRAYDQRDCLSNVQPGKTFDLGLKGALKLLAKPRVKRRRDTFPDIENDSVIDAVESDEAEEEVDPENYRTAFLLRADQAVRFASYSGPISEDLIAMARRVADAWTKLARKMENDNE